MAKNTSTKAMIVFRILYVILIGICIVVQRYDYAIMNIGVFLVTSILPFLAQKDSRYAWLDIYTVSVFITFIGLLVWTNDAIIANSGLIGVDKFFHAAGGAALAWFFMLFFEEGIPDKKLRALAVILGVLGIGAGWEVFEWVLAMLPGAASLLHSGLTDTMLDLVADTLGGMIAIGIILFKK